MTLERVGFEPSTRELGGSMIFGIVGGLLVGLTGLGIAADAIARRRRGVRRWADSTAGNQYAANQAAERARQTSTGGT